MPSAAGTLAREGAQPLSQEAEGAAPMRPGQQTDRRHAPYGGQPRPIQEVKRAQRLTEQRDEAPPQHGRLEERQPDLGRSVGSPSTSGRANQGKERDEGQYREENEQLHGRGSPSGAAM